MTLSTKQAHEVYEWYHDLESRLTLIIGVVPFVDIASTSATKSPRLASILLEAASLVDSLLRSQMPSEFTRLNGDRKTPRDANIFDYYALLEPELKLSASSSIVLVGLPCMLHPFESWQSSNDSPDWWRKYNKLKHSRLESADNVTLYDCLLATCALKNVIVREDTARSLVFRMGWSDLAQHNPSVAHDELKADNSTMPYLAYTNFFATSLHETAYSSLGQVRPGLFKNSNRLQAVIGRMGNSVESQSSI